MTHFIRQQYLDIELKGSESEGFALQHRLSGLYYAKMLPEMEKALDQCSMPGKHLVIDRLDIDAGIIDLNRIDQDLAAIVANKLIQRLTQEKAISFPEREKSDQHDSFFRDTEVNPNDTYFKDTEEKLWEALIHFLVKGHLPWSYRLPAGKSLEEVFTELLIKDRTASRSRIPIAGIAEALKSPNPTRRLALQFSEHFTKLLSQKISPDILKDQVYPFNQTGQEKLWEVFIYFLLNGSLPGSYKLPAEKSLEDVLTELLISDESITGNPVPVAKITEVFKSESGAKRLAFQFSESFIIKLLERISPATSTELLNLLSVSEKLSFAPEEIRLFRKFVIEKTLLQASSGKGISKAEIAKQVLDEFQFSTHLFPLIAKVFEQTWPEIKIPDNKPSTTKSEQGELFHQAKTELPLLDSEGFASNLSEVNRIENEIIQTETRIAEKSVSKETVEGIYIDNAGLVLLHPFLPRLFDALGISKEEKIVQPERALSLLHYLTTGHTKIPEYELVLPKILCEVPLLMPVSADYKITEDEKSEASALLDAVIKHWEALRNTSHDGLRGAFLLRSGKLIRKDDGDWLLQVESRTFDILLEYLPWGISMVKLPWMKEILWVEWVI